MHETEGNEGVDSGLYEVGFHLVPTVSENDVAAEAARITSILEKNGATIKVSEGPMLKGLTYTMEKTSGGKISRYDNGYFGSIVFETTADLIPEIRSAVEKLPNVLRSLVIETSPEALLPRERRVAGRIEPEKFRAEKPTTPAAPVSEEELDKSIEKLVTE